MERRNFVTGLALSCVSLVGGLMPKFGKAAPPAMSEEELQARMGQLLEPVTLEELSAIKRANEAAIRLHAMNIDLDRLAREKGFESAAAYVEPQQVIPGLNLSLSACPGDKVEDIVVHNGETLRVQATIVHHADGRTTLGETQLSVLPSEPEGASHRFVIDIEELQDYRELAPYLLGASQYLDMRREAFLLVFSVRPGSPEEVEQGHRLLRYLRLQQSVLRDMCHLKGMRKSLAEFASVPCYAEDFTSAELAAAGYLYDRVCLNRIKALVDWNGPIPLGDDRATT